MDKTGLYLAKRNWNNYCISLDTLSYRLICFNCRLNCVMHLKKKERNIVSTTILLDSMCLLIENIFLKSFAINCLFPSATYHNKIIDHNNYSMSASIRSIKWS